jgi:ubiquinone/menaquinone biosynthesis C-methylase UbiE
MDPHQRRIREQFTRQAEAFASAPPIRDEEALRLIVERAGAGPSDSVVDVACGPGIVTCAFAAATARATGIDLTPAMIGKARQLQLDKRLANVCWCIGDVASLPYADGAFSIAVSRFALHHMPDPQRIVAEMARVCRPGGRIAVVDVAVSPDLRRAAAFNAMEKLRDPSHVRALTLAELEATMAGGTLSVPRIDSYRMNVGVKGLLERSFPAPGDEPRIRAMFEQALADDGMGVRAVRVEDDIRFDYPIAILVADRL